MPECTRGLVRVLALMAIAAVGTGCGYSTKGNLPDHIKTVAVPMFKNRGPEPRVETVVTSGVINAFSNRGRVRPIDEADSILEGLTFSDFQTDGQVSDTEIGRKVVNLAVDRF